MAVLPIRDLFSSQSLTNSTQIVERKKVFVSKKCGCLAYYIRDLSRSQSLTNITQTVSSCVQTTSRVFRRGGGASQRLVEDGPASVLERRRREERMVQLVSLSEESTVRSCSDWLTTAGPQYYSLTQHGSTGRKWESIFSGIFVQPAEKEQCMIV